jgi:hypothetical protein
LKKVLKCPYNVAVPRIGTGRVRKKLNLSLAPDSLEWLEAQSEETGAPISRIVDRLVKAEKERRNADKPEE